MMIVLHPTYTIRLEIQDRLRADGQQNYFNQLAGKTGCDEVLAAVKGALNDAGIQNFNVYLEKFEHTSNKPPPPPPPSVPLKKGT